MDVEMIFEVGQEIGFEFDASGAIVPEPTQETNEQVLHGITNCYVIDKISLVSDALHGTNAKLLEE